MALSCVRVWGMHCKIFYYLQDRQNIDLAPGGQPLVQFDLRGLRETPWGLRMSPQTGLHNKHESMMDFSSFYIFVLSIIFSTCSLTILYALC